MIARNLEQVLENIEKSCRTSGRSASEVRLVAVTKTVPLEKIFEAARAGLHEIGESRVQESLEKFPKLVPPAVPEPLRRHLIGHLQRNKAGRAVELFDCIQSLDSERLLEALDRRAGELGKVQECLAEVKISEEPGKTGLAPEELPRLLESAARLKNVRIAGLMGVAPYCEDPEAARPYFARARKLFERFFLGDPALKAGGPALSLGMSHDFEAAIREGSTMVRIGSAIFGSRPAAKQGQL